MLCTCELLDYKVSASVREQELIERLAPKLLNIKIEGKLPKNNKLNLDNALQNFGRLVVEHLI
jgi:hypothetical protein